MQATDLQQNVINAMANGENIVVEAAPGSGKTTLISLAVKQLLSDNPKTQILAMSYTNSMKYNLVQKLDNRAMIYSMHQLGLSLLKSSGLQKKFEYDVRLHGKKGNPDEKYNIILQEIIGSDYNLRHDKEAWTIINETKELVDKVRLELCDINDTNCLIQVANKYHLQLSGEHINYLRQALQIGIDRYVNRGHTDFVDMLWLPIVLNVSPKKGIFIGNKKDGKALVNLDWIICDEFQDASPIIHHIIQKFSKAFNAKLLLVGDKNQSCFAFAAADTLSMDKAVEMFNCKTMPLNESFRCPESHVNLVNSLYGTNVISRRGIAGNIYNIEETEIIQYIKPADMVLGRTNGELLTLFLELLRKGIPARVIGLDLYDLFNDLFDMIEKSVKNAWSDIYTAVEDYYDSEVKRIREKYSRYRAEKMIEELASNVNMVNAYLDFLQPSTRRDFFYELKVLLDDNSRNDYVSLLTIHKGKGLESENIFILNANKFPYVYEDANEEDIQQEKNIHFIALTRSLENLYLVNSLD